MEVCQSAMLKTMNNTKRWLPMVLDMKAIKIVTRFFNSIRSTSIPSQYLKNEKAFSEISATTLTVRLTSFAINDTKITCIFYQIKHPLKGSTIWIFFVLLCLRLKALEALFFRIVCAFICPSVCLKLEIPSFHLYMGPYVHLTDLDRFAACPSVNRSVRPSI